MNKVSDVQVFPLGDKNSKLKAFARVILFGELQLTSLRIYDGSKGLFVSYPNDPLHKGNDYRQLFYPLTSDLRDEIENEILKAYHESIK